MWWKQQAEKNPDEDPLWGGGQRVAAQIPKKYVGHRETNASWEVITLNVSGPSLGPWGTPGQVLVC